MNNNESKDNYNPDKDLGYAFTLFLFVMISFFIYLFGMTVYFFITG